MKASNRNHFLYNKTLQPFANSNKHNMNKAETCLWKYALRGRQMKGYGFRRQRPVLKYIADFMCQKLKLIIEVDGCSHQLESIAKNDVIRQANLEKAGFTVIRFTNDEVLGAIGNVKEIIFNVVTELENRHL